MNDLNKAYLETYMKEWHQLKYAGYIKHLDLSVRKELRRIYIEELDPRAVLDINCYECVGDWVRILYTNYEKQYGEIPSLIRSTTTVNSNAFEKPRTLPLVEAVAAVLSPDPASNQKANKNKSRKPKP